MSIARIRSLISASLVLGLLFSTETCLGASLYWDGPNMGPGLVVGGSGNWNVTDTNWATTPIGPIHTNWTNGDDAFFTAIPSASATASLNAVDIDFHSITFGVSGYSLDSGGFNFIPSGNATITTNSGVTAKITAKITGAADLTVLGTGTLTLTNPANSFALSTDIDGGNLVVSGIITNTNHTLVGNTIGGSSLLLTGQIHDGGAAFVGVNPSSTKNSAIVSGGTWTNVSDVNVGFNSSLNALFIANGGTVSSSGAALKIAGTAGNGQNSVTVTDAGSNLNLHQYIAVGYAGGLNNMYVQDGASVTNTSTYIGFNSGANNNSVAVSNPGTTWTDSGTFHVGYNGSSNSFTISDGAAVHVTTANPAAGDALVGFGAVPNGNSDSNSLVVTGTGSILTVGNAGNQRTMYIGGHSGGPVAGDGSNNSMLVSDGGQVVVLKNGRIGDNTNSNDNSVTVTDPGSLWSLSGTLRVGTNGSGNDLNVLNGGAVHVGGSVTVGFNGGANNNSVVVDGAGSSLVVNQAIIGSNANFGLNSGNSLTVSNGGNLTALSTTFSPLSSSPILIAANPGATASLNIGAGGAPGTINALGIVGALGSASVVFNHDAPVYVFSTKMLGFLTVNHIGTGTTILTSPNAYFGSTNITQGVLQAGVVDVLSPVSTVAVGPSGTLNLGGLNQSTLDVVNNGVVDFGIGTQTAIFFVDGVYTQGSTGKLIERVNLAGDSDLLTATAAVNLDGALAVVPIDGYSVFHKYHIVHSDVQVLGEFSEHILTNSLVTGSIDYEFADVYITFEPNLIFAAETHNQREVAEQLDGITNPSADIITVLDVLVNLPVEEARKALDEMAGEQYTYLAQLDRYSNEAFNRRVFNAMRSTLLPCCCACSCESVEGWFQIEQGQSYASRDSNSEGIRSTNWDYSLGAFTHVCDGFLIGLAANYENDKVNFYQGGHTNWHTGQAALYGAYHCDWGYILADFIFGRSWGHVKRPIDFGSIHREAKSSPEVTQGMIYTEIGYNLCWCGIHFQPFLGAEVGIYNQRKFSECGADSLDLRVENRTRETYDSYLGAHITKAWESFSLSADIAWQHRFDATNMSTATEFVEFGDSFSIRGTKLGSNGVRGALNILGNVCETVDLYAEISGECWERWAAYGIDLGVSVRW